MAELTRLQLQQLAENTNIENNTAEGVTPLDVRNQYEEERDSTLNKLDDGIEPVDLGSGKTLRLTNTPDADDLTDNDLVTKQYVDLNTTTVGITPEQSADIIANNNKVGITTEQSDAIVLNTDKVGITTEQSDAIDLNTTKVGITTAQADDIDLNTNERHEHINKSVLDSFGEDANQLPTYNGNAIDTVIAARDVYDGLDSIDNTISLSASQGKVLKDVQVIQQTEIVANNAKVGITTEQADAIDLNTTKVGISTDQSDAIVLNTDKVGITPEQSSEIVINNAKVGITTEQSDDIVLNNAKVGITPEQASEIVINNDKVGITPEQATNISDNTLDRHSHLNKDIIDSFSEDENQKLTYNGEVVGSGEELVTQTLLYKRVTWGNEQGVTVPKKALGTLERLDDDAFVTVEADGLYDVTIQLNFGNMTTGERLSFALINSSGELFPSTGQSFVTASSSNVWLTTQIERTTWRVDLVAGQELYVGISTTDNDPFTFDVYSSSVHDGSYIELRQLPTQTVVIASDDVIPVTALESYYIPNSVEVDWSGTTGDIFTLPPVLSDGRYFVDYGLSIRPVTQNAFVQITTHIQINGNEVPFTTFLFRDNSGDVSNSDYKNMNEGSYVDLVAGDVVTLYMQSASNVSIYGTDDENEFTSFIRLNQLPTHTVVSTISEDQLVAQPLHYQRVISTSTQTITDPSVETAIDFPTTQTDSAGLYEVSGKLQMNLVDDDNGSWTDSIYLYVNNVQVGLAHTSYKKIQDVSDNSYFLTFSFIEELSANADIVIKFKTTAVTTNTIRVMLGQNDGSTFYSYIDLKQLPTHTVVSVNGVVDEAQPTYSTNTFYPELGGYVIEANIDATHGLVVAMQDQGFTSWWDASDLLSDASNHDSDGAKFKDWRLPTKRELNVINGQKTQIGGFETSGYYLCATEKDEISVSLQSFASNNQISGSKSATRYVRAVRSF